MAEPLSSTTRLSLSCFQAFKIKTTFADQELMLHSDSNIELKYDAFSSWTICTQSRQTTLLIQIHINMHWRVNFISYLGEDLPQNTPSFGDCPNHSPHAFREFFYQLPRYTSFFWGHLLLINVQYNLAGGPPKCALPKRTTCFLRRSSIIGIIISKSHANACWWEFE